MENSLPPGFTLESDIDQNQENTFNNELSDLPSGFQLEEDKYSTPGHMIGAGAEALSRGLIGHTPTALIEKGLGVPEEDIRARKEANPELATTGEVLGFGAGMLAGTGEAALLGKASQALETIPAIAKGAAEGASYLSKVGSAAAKGAADMAIMQSDDEVAKQILHEPNTSAETALSNIGLATALGGAGGALVSGAISPIWKATAGPKLAEGLETLSSHVNGSAAMLPQDIEQAVSNLEMNTAEKQISPEVRAAMSGNPTAMDSFNRLRETQNPAIINAIEKTNKDISESVMNKMGISADDVAYHSENELGNKVLDVFNKKTKEVYEPIAERLQKKAKEASVLSVSDQSRLDTYGGLLEDAMTKVGTDSPAYKIYNDYGNRILAKDTIGGLDTLKTEINNSMKQAERAADYNTLNALRDVKTAITSLQEKEIEKAAMSSEKLGIEGAGKAGEELLAERAAVNKEYAKYADVLDQLTNFLGVGDFRGTGTLMKKLSEKLTPEEVLRKFSIKGDADFIKFMGEHYPEVLQEVKKAELKRFLKPSIINAKGEMPIDFNKLSKDISKGMAGQKEYIEAIMPPGSIEAVESAKKLQDAIPKFKSSGTAGWMSKVFDKMPAGVGAAISMLMGHNPAFGYVLGEAGNILGRKAPEAMRLAHLRFLGSDQPIKAEGFKAMVDFLDSVYKGNNTISKAASNIFEGSTKVIPLHLIPDNAALIKLDKVVTKMQEAPYRMIAHQDDDTGHYLPDHKTAMVETTGRVVQYLSTLKPHAQPNGALGTPIQPSKQQIARYNRALSIAQQPAIVMQHIKSGTLSKNDVIDLNSMYPGLYQTMSSKIYNEMANAKAKEIPVPYKTRMGLSLFLASPVDNTMQPASIQSAQAVFAPKQQPINAPQGSSKKPSDKAASTMAKNAKSYMTPLQSSEAHKASK